MTSDLDIDWSTFDENADDSYQIVYTRDALDISAGVTLEVEIKVPAAYTNGDVIIQPLLQSEGYNPAYIAFADFTTDVDSDGWATITMTNLGTDTSSYNYAPNFDPTALIQVGLQFKWQNTQPASETIQIRKFSLINE